MNALVPLINFCRPLPVSPRLSPAKQHAAHLACAARYRTQASGLFGLARDESPFTGHGGPWGGQPELLRQTARHALSLARQELEAARAVRVEAETLNYQRGVR